GGAGPGGDTGGGPAHRRASGQAHVPGAAHRGQRGTRRAVLGTTGGAGPAGGRRPGGGAVVPLAGGPHRQAGDDGAVQVHRAGRRLAAQEEHELRTRGNTALAPDPVTRRRPARTEPHLTVAPPAPVSVPRAPFVALVLVVVVAGVLGILVLNTKINQNAFTIN